MSILGMGSVVLCRFELGRPASRWWVESHPLPAPPLPGDLADVLHILEPLGDQAWGGWKWLLPAAFLAFWWWRRQRRVPPRSRPAAPPRAPRRPSPGSDLGDKIEDLRRQVLLTRRYREGCHRLAALLRRRGEEVESQPMTVWTQGEIGAYLGDIPLSRVMALLTELQYGRQPPLQGDFEGACDLAAEASRGRRW